MRTLLLLPALAVTLWLGALPVAQAEPLESPHQTEWDPLEPMNRGVFWFNDRLDVFLIEPLGQGWEFITPQAVRSSLDRFFTNLRFPVRFAGNLFSGRLRNSGEEVTRFVVNTTVGVAGLFDPATGWGLELHLADLGVAFGRWGIGEGPYLVLPLFGPSDARDAVGLAGDSVLSAGPGLISPVVGAAVFGTNLLNSRALALEDVREAKAASLDYYTFMRNAFLQRRRALIENGDAPEYREPEDDLYELDDDED